ncbi:MAG: replication protein [Eubacterium sp.]
MANDKHRYWWFILYPESAPKDWKEVLTFRGLPCAISPLHEFDLKNEEGEVKKAHHHIILCYAGPTTFNNVKRLTVDELGQTIPKPIDNVRGAYEYLTHKNNPEKYQYSDEEIQFLNGFDIKEIVEQSEKDKASIKMAILDDIDNLKILEYPALLRYYKSTEQYEKFNVASSNTILFNTVICSNRHSQFYQDDNSSIQSSDLK